jgi:hypothetical protein
MPPAADQHLADYLTERPRTPAEEWLRAGFEAWLIHGDTLALHRCLGLPASPAGVRRIQRNRLLRQAAELIQADTPWQRAGKLLEAVRLFDLRKWPAWYRLDTAPPHATDLERVLFDLLKMEIDLPGTQRQYHHILLDE